MVDNTTTPLPAGLAQRPMHPRLRRPIPVVNVHPDGIDFRSVNHEQARACAESGWCGLCGRDLEDQIAFLGGPKSAEARIYADPGMHPACAEAAVTLCPHIAIRHHRPTPAHR